MQLFCPYFSSKHVNTGLYVSPGRLRISCSCARDFFESPKLLQPCRQIVFFQALFSIAPIFSPLSAQSAIMRHWRDWGAPQVKRRPRLSAISYHCFTKWNLRYTIFARIINFTSHIAYFTKIESTDACLV